MRRRTSGAAWAVAAFAVLVVGAATVPAGAYAPAERSSATAGIGGTPGGVDANGTADGMDTARTTTSLGEGVGELIAAARAGNADPEFVSRSGDGLVLRVTIEAAPDRVEDVTTLVDQHGSVIARFDGSIDARLPPDAVETIARSPAVTAVHRPGPVVRSHQGAVVSEGLGSVNVTDQLHASGVNGSNVTVAVVDTGFDLGENEIDHHVAGFEDFEGDGMDNASGLHGTAVAELVVDTAPNVSLLLYEINTSTGMGAAVEHITRNTSADVATMSLGLLTGPFDGTSRIDGAIENSVANGTTWFVSAGNYADGQHYNQTWQDDDGNGWMNISGSGETIGINAEDSFQVYVSWSGDNASSQDYDVYLNDSATGEPVDISNTTQNGSPRGVEIVRSDESGAFTLGIRRGDAEGTADFDVFTTGSTDLHPSTAARSVTRPATAESAIAVGAVNRVDLDLAAFSSRGPTVDGRVKPDLVGPNGVSTSAISGFSGTSAAAPHAAGVAALVIDSVNGSIDHERLRRSLRESATRLADDGPNNRTGYGLVNATGAVRAVGGTVGTPVLTVTDLRAPHATTIGETIGVNATITNTGDTVRTPSVEYLFNGAVNETRVIDIDGGESTVVRFNISTDGLSPGTYEHGIAVGDRVRTTEIDLRQPATFQLSPLDAPVEAVAGENITVNTTLRNVGDVSGAAEIEYLADNTTVTTRTVSLPAGASTRIVFGIPTANTTPGTHVYGIGVAGDSRVVNITIQQPATFEMTDLRVDAPRYREVPSDYEIVDGYRKAPSEYLTVAVVPLNGTYRVNATVRNVGDIRGTTEIGYVFDGVVTQTRSVTLAGGATTTVRFEIASGAAPGRYDHGVRGAGSNLTAKIRLNAPPKAAFSVTTPEPTASDPVTFDASESADVDGDVVTYEWDLDGDGEYDDATGVQTEAAFTPAGEVTVGLRIVDDVGGTNTTETTLTVLAAPTPGPTESAEPTGTPPTGSVEPPDDTQSDTTGGSTDTPGLPGFGPVPALLAVVAFVLLVRRIHRDGGN